MSRGILVFAYNNASIDYIKQAKTLALRASKYLNLPTSLVTDHPIDDDAFDHVIVHKTSVSNIKKYNDGALSSKRLQFRNDARPYAYDLSPYDETILLDSDYIIADDLFKNCFEQSNDFLIYKSAQDLANNRNYREFKYISDTGIHFYWATCVFFRKTETNRIFFDLLKHIQEEWTHYKRTYQIVSNCYRNDHAFSIAIHMMNNFGNNHFAKPMPGNLLYITDKDYIQVLDEDRMVFLLGKHNRNGEYTLASTKGQSVHVMNKFSLNEVLDE